MNLALGVLLAQILSVEAAIQAAPPPADNVIPLRTLVRDALTHNLTLHSVRATTRSVETSVQASRAVYDPLLQLTPSYTTADQQLLAQPGLTLAGTQKSGQVGGSLGGTLRTSTQYSVSLDTNWRDQGNTALLPPGGLNPNYNTTLGFTLAQPLLRGFGPSIVNAQVDISSLASRSARSRLGRTVEQIIADVETAYWSLGLAEATERLSRDSYQRATELAARNEKMRELKLISDVDAITSRRGVQQRLTSLTDAVRRRADAAERLMFLVYGKEAAPQLAATPNPRTEPPPATFPKPPEGVELEGKALESRQDVEAARLDVNQGEVTKRVARNSLLPDARLSATYSALTLGTDSFRLFNTARPGDIEEGDWRVGLNFSYPLWNRSARAAWAKARYDNEAQVSALASAESQVRSEVRAAARAIRANLERLEQSRLSFEYAKEQYAAGEKQLQLGLIDSFRLLQMEEDVAGAEQVYETTRYELALAITSYELALGTIDERYRFNAEAPPR